MITTAPTIHLAHNVDERIATFDFSRTKIVIHVRYLLSDDESQELAYIIKKLTYRVSDQEDVLNHLTYRT